MNSPLECIIFQGALVYGAVHQLFALNMHLGQVLHIQVKVVWLVALIGLVGQHRLLGLEGI